MKNKKSKIKISLLFFIPLLFLFLFLSFFYKQKITNSATADNVAGWAWSENIGWISFNCTNENACGSSNYGVNIADNGILSGYAWSEHIGWISFNQTDLSGCPQSPCQAWLSTTTGQFNGWAKALAASGGWDGWIHLRGSNYGVYLSTSTPPVGGWRQLSGWAWGGDVIGWISFNCNNENVCNNSNYFVKTSFDLPPQVTNLSYSKDCCAAMPYYSFAWQFQDPDLGDTQSAYQLQVSTSSIFSTLQVDTGKVTSTANSASIVLAKNPSLPSPPNNPGQLGYNTTYYWRVKVWDTYGNKPSDWLVASTTFTTPLHIYPTPNFYWLPETITQDEFIQFCSIQDATCTQATQLSVCYDSNNNQISCQGKSFYWTMPSDVIYATGSSATTPNPKVKFQNLGPKTISLSITDDVGTCTTTKSSKVFLPLPKWKEKNPQQ
jgi:hypothetical protein